MVGRHFVNYIECLLNEVIVWARYFGLVADASGPGQSVSKSEAISRLLTLGAAHSMRRGDRRRSDAVLQRLYGNDGGEGALRQSLPYSAALMFILKRLGPRFRGTNGVCCLLGVLLRPVGSRRRA